MVFKLRTCGRHQGMGTGWVSPKAPTQTDFFFFMRELELKMGAVLVVVKPKMAIKKILNFPLVFCGIQTLFGP